MKNHKVQRLLAAIMLMSVLLTACGKPKVWLDETAGVLRDPNPATTETTEPNADDTSAETEATPPAAAAVEPSAKLENGKYVYSIPEPDRSGLSDLSAIKAMSRGAFPDANGGTDWYPGKFERNLSTGEVKTVWDRSAETLSILDKYGAIYRKNEEEKVVYFTFDLGYENGWTEPILDVLKEKNVPGLFFVVGHYVETAPQIIKRIYDEGHLVGNHTYNHINAAKPDVTEEKFIEELQLLEDALKKNFPDAPPTVYYRPGYGACNEWSLAVAEKMGLTTVLWSWAHYDYVETDQPDVAAALEKAKKGLHNGAVYLFHCVGSTNPAMLGDLIDYIRAEGYEIRPMTN